jgi:hypothetical protein
MPDRCDVCESYRPEANQRERKLTPVTYGEHTVVLCEMHRLIAERAGVTTFEELREHYGESGDGRRSYVPRRGRARGGAPKVERRQSGRRATDPA